MTAGYHHRTEVVLGNSTYGTPEPRLVITAARRTHHRLVRAAAYRLAAEVEVFTLKHAATDTWCVRVEHGRSDETAWVVLELAEGDAAETQRALDLLHAVAEDEVAS